MLDQVLSIVAPHHCSGCGELGSLLCHHCKYDIIDEHENRCLVCLAPTTTGLCTSHRRPYQKAWFVGERNGTLQRIIGNFKFNNARAASKTLAELLDRSLPDFPHDVVVVPVPTVSSHIRERGYDHTLLVVRKFAKSRDLKIAPILTRSTTTKQRSANKSTRRQQAKRAFALKGPVNSEATYLVIDDVFTTGATIEYATRLLKGAGAKKIWVAVIARQTLD